MQTKGFFNLVISTFGTSLLAFTVVICSIASSSAQKTLGNEMEQTYTFIKKWGGDGTGDGKFLRPHDLDFSPDEKFSMLLTGMVIEFRHSTRTAHSSFAWGKLGNGNGQFHVPYGIDVDIEGNVWVADRANDRMQKFDSKGKFILKFGNKDAEPSNEPGKFDNPRDVAVDKDLRYVYVADSKNNRIQKFDLNGSFIEEKGKFGNKRGEFNLPTTIVIDSKGNFIVNERGNERLQKFDSNWNPVLMWGSKGSGNSEFCHIEHIAVDKYDNVYVTDPQSDPGCSQQPRVLKFDAQGNFITKWGSYGEEDGEFVDPEHLAIDSEGRVYVSDRKNDNIQVFEPIIDR